MNIQEFINVFQIIHLINNLLYHYQRQLLSDVSLEKIDKIFKFSCVLAHPESQDRTITSGHRLTLSCEIDSENNRNFLGTIEWFHNGSPLKINSANRNRIDYGNGTLIIDQTSVKTFYSLISNFLI